MIKGCFYCQKCTACFNTTQTENQMLNQNKVKCDNCGKLMQFNKNKKCI